MITRLQSGIFRPIDHLSLNTFLISHIPKNPFDALKDPQWRNAMYDEYNALVKMALGYLYQGPQARLVANGSSQQLGVNFDETFSPVVKPTIIRMVLSLVVSCKWSIHQLDVKNAFLNGYLSELSTCISHPVLLMLGFSVCLSSALLQQIIDSLHNEFDMTDLEALNYFLGISADRNSTCLFLSQKKHALQLLERPHMVYCNPSRTPIDTESKLDLSYAIQQVCLYMHDPREPHFATLKHILRYVRGTVDFGLQLYASATTSLVGYTDVDWAGKRQHTLSRSSVKAEYHGVANVVTETAWLRNLLHGLHSPLSTVTLVYCDNVSAVYISTNPVQHQRTKHIEIDIHFVRDMVTAGHVKVLHVPYHY
ncbi:ribonuclease H-like domain-containing protein [Tanacetum coccineum]